MKQLFVISLGGSLIVPDDIDWGYLKKFRKTILKQIKKGREFILICGGGQTARKYQSAASQIVRLTRDDLDWLGIHSTRLNAHLLRTIFRKFANPRIIFDPREKVKLAKPILVAAGWLPGWSTDYDAVILAKTYGAVELINLTDVDYIYDKNPKIYKNARPIKEMSWVDYGKLFGWKWKPGLKIPFDPIAARAAKKNRLKVIIANGKNLKNLEAILDGKSFVGTVIRQS